MKFRKLGALALVCTVLLTGCGGISGSTAPLLKANGETVIEAGYFNFAFHMAQANFDSNYLSMYGADMWSQDVYGYGNTMEHDIKASVLGDLKDNYLATRYANEHGIVVSDEEKAKIEEAIAAFEAANSKEVLDELGYTQDYLRRYLQEYALSAAVFKAVCSEVNTVYNPDEYVQASMTFAFFSTSYRTDADGNELEVTEDFVKEQKEKAIALAAGDYASVEEFSAAAKDVASTTQTETYSTMNREPSEYFEVVFAAADKLKEGEYTKTPVEDDSIGGYYVIYKTSMYDKEATDTYVKQKALGDKYQAYYDLTQTWGDDLDFDEKTSLIERVKITTIFAENPNATVNDATATNN